MAGKSAYENQTDDAQPLTREFIQAVRQAAGWRVAPRQIAAALEALQTAEEPATPERVAQLVEELRGDRSERQRRNADLWRALGAQLAIRDAPGDPEAQRAFLGVAREAAGGSAPDSLLLHVALAMAATGDPLDAELIGRVSRRIQRRHGRELSADQIQAALPEALATERDAQRQARRARQRRVKREPAFPPARPAGRRPRGASYGGRRRRR